MPELRTIASIRPVVGRPDEYGRAKALLDKGRHPAFIGRNLVARTAANGGLIFFMDGEDDAAVAMMQVSRSVLTVLNVAPQWRGSGIGGMALSYIKPNFARVVEAAVPWFEKNGYTPIGTWKQGISLRTRVMVRTGLIGLAGRLRSRLEVT